MAERQPGGTRLAVIAYGMMIAGMAAHAAFNDFLGVSAWSWAEFGAALVISPIVYSSFLAVVRSRIDATTGALVAFQNGFFWKNIIQAAGPLAGVG